MSSLKTNWTIEICMLEYNVNFIFLDILAVDKVYRLQFSLRAT